MLNLKFNRFLNCRILLFLVTVNNLFGDSQKPEFKKPVLCISESEIYRELNSIIKLEQKNSTFRKLGYATVATGIGCFLFKNYYSTPLKIEKNNSNEDIVKVQNEVIEDYENFINLNSARRVNLKEEIGKINDQEDILKQKSYYFNAFKPFFIWLIKITPEERAIWLANQARQSRPEPKHGYISGFFHGVWGIGTSIFVQIALATAIQLTSKNFYKHFMPLSYEYFITHHTNFEQALEMVNACTLLDPEKAQDELYVALSKENLKLAYNQLIKEGQKVIAFILYTRIKNKNMEQISKTTLDNLTENLKNNLSDISNFIETHNLLAIRNRIAAINNTSKMVVNFETVSAAN